MTDYYSILTNKGKQLEAASKQTKTPVVLSKFVIGDGNGAAVVPDPAKTALVHEVWRGDISSLKVSPDQENQFIAYLAIPVTVGGFVIREVGLLTDAGELYAVGNCAAIEKPTGGVSVSLQFRLAVSETAQVELKIATGDGLFLRQDANLSDVRDKDKSLENIGGIPKTRKINDKALGEDITITSQDIFDGQSILLSATDNLNDIKQPGLYHQPASANATLSMNYPEGMAGNLIVYKNAGVTQEYRVYNGSKIYTRSQYSTGNWTIWAKEYNTQNKPTPADIAAVAIAGDKMTGQLKIGTADALRIFDPVYGIIFRRSETNFYLIPTVKDKGENGDIGQLRPLTIDLATGKVTLGNGATVLNGIGLGVANELGGNSITLGDGDTGFKQSGDGLLDVIANNVHVFRFQNDILLSNKPMMIKNGGAFYLEKDGLNPRSERFFSAGDATRGNRLEFDDDSGWKAYLERHPTNGIQLVVNGRIATAGLVIPGDYANFDERYLNTGECYTKVESNARFMQNVQLGVEKSQETHTMATLICKAPAGHVVTGTHTRFIDGHYEVDMLYFKPIQKYINGAWVTIEG